MDSFEQSRVNDVEHSSLVPPLKLVLIGFHMF